MLILARFIFIITASVTIVTLIVFLRLNVFSSLRILGTLGNRLNLLFFAGVAFDFRGSDAGKSVDFTLAIGNVTFLCVVNEGT